MPPGTFTDILHNHEKFTLSMSSAEQNIPPKLNATEEKLKSFKKSTNSYFSFEKLSEDILDRAGDSHIQDGIENEKSISIDKSINTIPEENEIDFYGEADDDHDFLKSVYEQTDVWLNSISRQWPIANTKHLADFQKHLRFLLRILRNPRYPRLAIIGRRGSGYEYFLIFILFCINYCRKSSLLNAILGQMVAIPGHTQAQTGSAKLLKYRLEDGSGLDVLDTRGLNEGGKPIESDDCLSAADSIINALHTCPVDAVLFVHKIKEVDSGIENDLVALQEVLEKSKLMSSKTPVIAVLTHCDELEPSDLRRPNEYDEEKFEAIDDAKQTFLKNLVTFSPEISELLVGVVPVSCAVIWLSEDEDQRIFPHPTRDYRYNLDKLMDLLLRNVEVQAVFRTVQAARAIRVKKEFAEFMIRLFASLGALIALTPIPASDIIPLTALITYQTYTIARLGSTIPKITDISLPGSIKGSPEKVSMEESIPTETENKSRNTKMPSKQAQSVSKFLSILGLTSLLGVSSRYLLTQLLKLSLIPGSTAASAVISFSIVRACGYSAIKYFLENGR